jgi:cell division protein FtsB
MAVKPLKNSDSGKTTGQFSGIQIMFATILAIGLFLAIDFSGRISASQPLQAAYDRVQDEIHQLRLEQAQLIEQRDYVRSDAYVAQWARSEGRMTLPGEILIIPVPSGVTVAQVAPVSAPLFEDLQTTPEEPDTWLLWWTLFFDSPPPDFR